jgi:hypothetical protein
MRSNAANPDRTLQSSRRHANIQSLIFYAFPNSLGKDFLAPVTLGIHINLKAVMLHQVEKGSADELAALIRIQNSRGTVVPNRGLEDLHAEIHRHAVG